MNMSIFDTYFTYDSANISQTAFNKNIVTESNTTASLMQTTYNTKGPIYFLFKPIFDENNRKKKKSLYNYNISSKLSVINDKIWNDFITNIYIYNSITYELGKIPDLVYLSELINMTNMTYEILDEKYYI
jgi:hypothetical protein